MADKVMYIGGQVVNGDNANCRKTASSGSDLRFHMAFGDQFTVTNSTVSNGYVYGYPTLYKSKGYAYVLQSCLQDTKPTIRNDTWRNALGNYYLQEGTFGRYVYNLQLGLREAGCLASSADGLFEVDTKTAVINFQNKNGLDADGIAGDATKEKLYSLYGKQIEEGAEV